MGLVIAKASENLADEIDKADNAEINLDYDYKTLTQSRRTIQIPF